MMCRQSYQWRYKEQQEAIVPSGRKGWEDECHLSEPSCNPRREGYLARELAVKEYHTAIMWRNGIPTIVKDESLKSFRDEEERAQSFSPASTNPLHMTFLLLKSKRIHSARDSDHWSLTFRPQQGKDWERDLGWCKDRVSLLCLSQAPSLSLNAGDGKQWAQQTDSLLRGLRLQCKQVAKNQEGWWGLEC